jgi:hypothetical protein
VFETLVQIAGIFAPIVQCVAVVYVLVYVMKYLKSH